MSYPMTFPMASVWFSRNTHSTFFSSRLFFVLITVEEAVVVVVLTVGGFLGRGSLFPNCQSDEVVEQLFDSVPVVPVDVSSVVFDVEASLVCPEVGPEVEPEVAPEEEPAMLVVVEVDTVDPRRIDRIGVDEALGLLFPLGGLDVVVVLDPAAVGVSEVVEVTDGTFGFWTLFVFGCLVLASPGPNEPKVELVDFLTIEFVIVAPLSPPVDVRLIFGFVSWESFSGV